MKGVAPKMIHEPKKADPTDAKRVLSGGKEKVGRHLQAETAPDTRTTGNLTGDEINLFSDQNATQQKPATSSQENTPGPKRRVARSKSKK